MEHFPFNSIEDDMTFAAAASHFASRDMCPSSDLIFNPLDFEDDYHGQLEMLESDPDLQFYNNYRCIQNVQNCCYYTDTSFNRKCKDKGLCDSYFSTVHFNIRSIPKNFNSAEIFLSNLQFKFTVIALTETWLNPFNCDCYCLPGYTIESKCRSNRSGGGVALMIQQNINYRVRDDLCEFCEKVESLFIEIPNTEMGTNKNTIIGVVYRPPGGNIDDFNVLFGSILDRLKRENKLLYLLGDFNINLINADSHQPTSNFLDSLYAASLFPLINRPTRITSQTATLIDNVFCNEIMDVTHFNGIICTDISDHYPVFSINMGSNIEKRPTFIKMRKVNNVTVASFKDKLQNTNWDDVLNDADPRAAFSRFYRIFIHLYNQSFPVINKKIGYSNKKSWLTSGLKNSIRIKNQLYFAQKKYPTANNINRYKKYKLMVKKLLKISERDYYDQLIENNKSNARKSWNIIKDVIGKNNRGEITNNFRINNTVVSDPKLIADSFNRFYVNIGPNYSRNSQKTNIRPSSYIRQEVGQSIYLQDTTENEVTQIVKHLKNSSHGPDGVRTDIFKQTFTLFLVPFVHLLNLSLNHGYFPDELKLARVSPIFKAGDPMEIKNYRPISILNVFSKVFEKIMYVRTLNFLNDNMILYDLQFGFRKSYNTSSALIYLVDKIVSAIEKGEYIIGTFIDLSKAFDCVNHSILLGKLYKYGIRGLAHSWFSSYLTNRSQFVVFKDTESQKMDITCGVPQGSILGPLLFLIYVNDLQNVSDNIVPIMYADDTNLFISGKNLTDLISTLNCELGHYMTWMNVNKLSVNVSKTNYVIFRSKRNKIPSNICNLFLDGTVIERVSSVRFLGVILDETLSWLPHINHVKNKVAKGMGIISKARKCLKSKTLLSLYYSFIYPHLIYCIEVWGCTCKTYLIPILKIQRKAIRIMFSLPYWKDLQFIFQEYKILNFAQLYNLFTCLFVFKYKKGMLPRIFLSFFEYPGHEYRTRSQSLMNIPQCNTSFSQKRIRYMGVKLSNSLALTMDWNLSFHAFKRNLKYYLLNHPIEI